MSAHEILMAFPSEQHETQDGLWNQTFDPGMTLRDWFAGQALAAVVAQMMGGQIGDHPVAGGGPAGFAASAYDIADAMLKARTS